MPKKKSTVTRPLLPVLHIYCEGEKTEPNYIDKYLASKPDGERRKKVIKVEPTKTNTPVQLVEEAIKHKERKDCPEGDVFWVVYDRESKTKYQDTLHSKALIKAKAGNINVALSNVCFELWILLHFRDNSKPYSSYDDLMSSSDLKKQLATVGIANYEKGNAELFRAISHKINDARARAVTMNQSTLDSSPKHINQPYQLNPYTDMHKLMDAIDNFK